MTTTTRAHPRASLETIPTAGSIWRGGLGASAIAAGTNLALYSIATIADVSFLVRRSTGAEPILVPAGHVVVASLLPLLFATGLAVLASRRSVAGLRLVQAAAAIAAVASLLGPLSLDAELGTKLT